MTPDYSRQMSLEEWHQRYTHQAGWTAEIQQRLFAKGNVKAGDKILEIGSGTGALLQQLALNFNYHLAGIDIDRSALYFSKNHNPIFSLAQADGYHLPFPTRIFKICFCHYLLLWVENPHKLLTEMRRVIKPGGCLIALAEPDHQARIDYPPALEQLGKLQTKSLQTQGVDITMGRKLSQLFNLLNLRDIECGILGAQWSTENEFETDSTEWKTIKSDLADQLNDDQLLKYRRIDQQARQEGSRVLFVPTFYAAGVIP